MLTNNVHNVHSPTSPPCSDELQTIEYNTNRKSSWTVHILYPPHDGGIVHANVYSAPMSQILVYT